MHESINIVILGVGTVGKVVAAAFAKKHPHTSFTLHVVGRFADSAKGVADRVQAKYGFVASYYGCDVCNYDALVAVLDLAKADIVINVATPDTHLNVMRACLAVGSHYIDTAVYEQNSDYNVPPPWYSHELTLRESFRAKGLTAILSIGFDPGVVNVFCKKIQNDYLDSVETIDILCANAGIHNQFFATNFNAAVNLKELCEETGYWQDGSWHSAPPFSRHMEFDFPEIGRQKLYSVGHDEVHSLSMHMPEAKVEFWMRVGDSFKSTFEVLQKVGMLSLDPIDLGAVSIAPLDYLAKVLPAPETFASSYRGTVCVGALVGGKKNGKSEQIFMHSVCRHEDCLDDLETQVTAFTTAIPAMAAAVLIATGQWNAGTMVHPEELPPDPFLNKIRELGLDWRVASVPCVSEWAKSELVGL